MKVIFFMLLLCTTFVAQSQPTRTNDVIVVEQIAVGDGMQHQKNPFNWNDMQWNGRKLRITRTLEVKENGDRIYTPKLGSAAIILDKNHTRLGTSQTRISAEALFKMLPDDLTVGSKSVVKRSYPSSKFECGTIQDTHTGTVSKEDTMSL